MFIRHRSFCVVLGISPLALVTASASASIVADGGFENPALGPGQFWYNATGSAWTFTGNAGVDHPFSAFYAPPPPEGVQAAFLQSHQSSTFHYGAFSQAVNLPGGGSYVLSYLHAGRPEMSGWGGNVAYEVLLDSLVIATSSTISGQAYTPVSIPFSATAGPHVLTFRVSPSQPLGDNTSFIDDVGIVPAPGSAGLATLAGLAALRRRR